MCGFFCLTGNLFSSSLRCVEAITPIVVFGVPHVPHVDCSWYPCSSDFGRVEKLERLKSCAPSSKLYDGIFGCNMEIHRMLSESCPCSINLPHGCSGKCFQ